MEVPIREIDGIVAALTHGSRESEIPIDYTGRGVDEKGDDILPNKQRRTLRHRDGSDIVIRVQEHAGDLARRVQRQYREENIIQNIGRGRAVYRDTPLSVIVIAESVPESLIVDEVIGFEDLCTKAGGPLWDAARLAGGVIEATVLASCAPHLGDTKTFQGYIDQWMGELSTDEKYHKVVVKRDGFEHAFYVPSHSSSWMDEFKASLRGYGWTGTLDIIARAARTEYAAGVAPIDAIEEYLREENQAAVEQQRLEHFANIAEKKGVWRQRPNGTFSKSVLASAVPTGYELYAEGPYARRRYRLDVWMMLEQMHDAWARSGVDEDEAAPREIEGDEDRFIA